MSKPKFKRTKEDFICGVCGAEVRGNGYTNHCPHCLTSKHVDVNPGDRASACGGLMPTVTVERKSGVVYLVQRCSKCGHTRRNKAAPEDDFNVILEVMRGQSA